MGNVSIYSEDITAYQTLRNVCIYSEWEMYAYSQKTLQLQLDQKTIVQDRCSYIIVINNEKTYFFVSYDYGLIESQIYFRVTVLVKSHVYRFIELQLLYSYI